METAEDDYRSRQVAGLRITHVMPSGDDEFSGPGNVLLSLLPIQTALGMSTRVVAGHRRKPGALLRAMEIRADLQTRAHRGYLARFHGSASLLRLVVKEVKRADVVVAHSFFNLPGIVACLTARRHRKPLIIAPHGSLSDFDTRKHATLKSALAPLWRRCLARCVIWCMTERELLELKTYGAQVQPRIVPPHVAALIGRDSAPGPSDEIPAAQAGGCVVTFLGRIDDKKGIARLVDAFERVADDRDRLIIAGSGQHDHLARIAAKITQMGRKEQISLLGWAEGDLKTALLSKTDVFALLSDHENLALSVAEAMAHGLAVLVTEEVALADLVQRYDAGVVTSREPLEIADRLNVLMTDRALRATYGQNAIRAIEANFSEATVRAQFKEMILAAVEYGD